jgi:hypothetical protein
VVLHHAKALIRVLAVTVALASCGSTAWAQSAPVETWISTSARSAVGADAAVGILQEARFRGGSDYFNMTELSFTRVARREPFDRAGLAVRAIHLQQEGRWRDQQRALVFGTVRSKTGSVLLEDTSTVEYQFHQPNGGPWRYRNRLKLTVPLRPGTFIYVADEVHFSFSPTVELYRNRASAGVLAQVSDRFTAELYVMRQVTRGTREDEGETRDILGVFGARLQLRF